ncbi:hypothetical protein [Caulobacter flavus]|uniref:hypothetical protein n=1 Tax=Caulobacter flavus TaxID=1679497 RepID=UPI0011AEFC92|nr:hypothetical protein [Caulobacter flavus]
MPNIYSELTTTLLSLVEPGFGRRGQSDLIAQVDSLTREIERASGNHGYVCEKAGNVREWVRKACSSRPTHWTRQQLEGFAYEDAYRLHGAWSAPSSSQEPI